jgi:CHAT domain-containing protein/tetratricopeptide (TPR) repeat protein
MWQTGSSFGGPAKRWPALVASVLFTTGLAAGARAARLAVRQEGVATREVAVRAQDVRPLEQGIAVERAISGGDTHAYQLRLDAGQFAHIVVEQRGIDVAIRVYGSDAQQTAEVDGPSGMQGPEAVYLVAETTGTYRVEVRALEEKAPRGSYEVRLKEVRQATAQDKNLMAAQRVYAEGDRARRLGTKEGRQEAIRKFDEARGLYRAGGERRSEADTLHGIGYMYATLGDKLKALEYYNQALPLRRMVGDRSGEAYTLTNMGVVYDSIGEKQKALDHYGQALPLWKAVGDPLGEGATLSNLGNLHSGLGETQKSLDYYQRALPLQRSVGDRNGEARTLTNIGISYDALGEMQKALDYYRQALPLWKVVADRSGEALILASTGVAYATLGEKQKALDYLNQSLELRRTVGDRRGEASTLNNLGAVYNSIGEGRKALDYYGQSLALRRAVGDRRGEAYTLNNLGVVYEALGEKQKALDYFNQSLVLRRTVGDRSGEANTLTSLGVVYYSLGEWQKALDYYNQALPLSRAAGDRGWEATTLRHLARLERDRGNLAAARKLMSDALPLVESLRAKVAVQELRASFFSTVRDHYELYIDILMRSHKSEPSAGHAAQALQISERARARSLLELLAEAGTDIRQGVDPQLAEREHSLRQRLNSKLEYQIRLLSTKHTPEQAAAVAAAIPALTAELEEVQGYIRTASPVYAALTLPQPSTLSEIQQRVLDPETLLLEYALGEERSYLWLVSQTSLSSFILPKRAEIEAAAVALTRLLSEGSTPEEFDRQAIAMSRMLLAPVASHLGRKRLVIVAEGALQYVPFAALPRPPTPGRATAPTPLVATHEIVSLPSASTLISLRRQVAGRRPPAKRLAVFADPVFTRDDARIKSRTATAHTSSEPPAKGEAQPAAETARQENARAVEAAHSLGLKRAGIDLPRLPFSRHEAERLLSLVPRREALAALDFKASQATAISPELRDYRIVHFATHGYLNTERPELSGLVLSLVDERGEPQDGFLSLSEIYNLRLSAELVVLSACQTGLGKQVQGEGLVGLTRGFMYAGVPRVVASLWAVQDRATAEMMGRLYEAMLQRGARPAAALRAAQLAMQREERWSAPHLWAGFIIQGEWR